MTDPPTDSPADSPPAREPRAEAPIAHRLRQYQRRLGRHLEAADLPGLASQLALPLARVRSAAGFFDEFRELSPGSGADFRHCGDLPCALARGDIGQSRAVGETLACLGRCHLGPLSMDRHGEMHGAAAVEEIPARCLAPEARLTRDTWEKESAACVAIVRREGWKGSALLDRLADTTGLDRHRRKEARTLTDRWTTAARAASSQRFVVCHGEAGNPGSTGHAWILRRRPHAVIDGMILTGLMIGATEAVICVHHDLPEVFSAIEEAIREATALGKLGEGVFEITALATFGAHVGGEETALINAIEGRRGEARTRPPEPELAGVFGLPTVIETAETFALLPGWLSSQRDPGHRLVSVTPPFGRPGWVEIDASVSIRRLAREASGNPDGENHTALLLGGPFGGVVFPENRDLRLDAEVLAGHGLSPGHWGLTPLPPDLPPAALARHWLDFAARESCGKCSPCRLGPLAAMEALDSADLRARDRFIEILDTIRQTSLCGFGRDLPTPLLQLIDHFGVDHFFTKT